MHPEVEKHLEKIRAVAQRYGVDQLEIFGSAVTDAFDPMRSDVDFIVHYPGNYIFGPFGKKLFDLEEELTEILGRPAQLVMTRALTKERFRLNANKTRTTVYERSTVEGVAGRPAGAMSATH